MVNAKETILVSSGVDGEPCPRYGGPPGGDSSIKMPGCVCLGSENVPILKDALEKTPPY